jgi:hypothetical protein
MILVCRAEYNGRTDTIQVAIMLQEDDGTSASPRLLRGTVEYLHRDAVMFADTFDRHSAVLWRKDEDDDPVDDGRFFSWLLHPPAQQQLQAKVSVVMADGEQQDYLCPVTLAQEKTDAYQNPQLPGREPTRYEHDLRMP